MNRSGIFTISLDFELFWGVRDHKTLQDYGEVLLGARQAIPVLLKTFAEHDIHVTWATVGFLFANDKAELDSHMPHIKPTYRDHGLDPYPHLRNIGRDEQEDPYHYANSLIKEIAMYPGQEIASHTFSHYYCMEPGQTKDAFRSDLAAALQLARRHGYHLHSMVFPRNQCNADYLATCAEFGFIAFRGNQPGWMYSAGNTWQKRLGRLLDTYLPLSGNNLHDLDRLSSSSPVNIPASRILRPVNTRLKYLEPLRLALIKSEMSRAAEQGRLYHLWWHPHNFGKNLSDNMRFLEKILAHFRILKRDYGMRSMNMKEVACEVTALATIAPPNDMAARPASQHAQYPIKHY